MLWVQWLLRVPSPPLPSPSPGSPLAEAVDGVAPNHLQQLQEEDACGGHSVGNELGTPFSCLPCPALPCPRTFTSTPPLPLSLHKRLHSIGARPPARPPACISHPFTYPPTGSRHINTRPNAPSLVSVNRSPISGQPFCFRWLLFWRGRSRCVHFYSFLSTTDSQRNTVQKSCKRLRVHATQWMSSSTKPLSTHLLAQRVKAFFCTSTHAPLVASSTFFVCLVVRLVRRERPAGQPHSGRLIFEHRSRQGFGFVGSSRHGLLDVGVRG